MSPLLSLIIVCVIAGLLAKSAVPGEGPGGCLGDLVTGLIGAFVGGWLFTTFLGHTFGGWIGTIFVAFVGAVVLLLVLRAISGRRGYSSDL